MLLIFTVVSVFAFAMLTIAAVIRPAYAFGILLVLYPFEQLIQNQSRVLSENRSVLNYLVAVIALLAVAIKTAGGKKLFVIDKTFYLIVSLFVIAYASITWSQNPELSLLTLRYYTPYIAVGIGILPLVINRPRDVTNGIEGFLFISAPVTLALLSAPFLVRSLALNTSTFDEEANPLAIATFSSQVIICGLAMLLGPRRPPLARAGFVALVGAASYLLLRSGTRGQLVGALVGSVFVAATILSGAKRRNALLAVIPIAVFLFAFLALRDQFVVTDSGERLATRWDFEQMSSAYTESRGEMVRLLVENWTASVGRNVLVLFAGIGAGSSYEIMGTYCHVVPVEVLCEYGVFAFVIFSGAVILAVRNLAVLLNQTAVDPQEKFGVALIGGLFLLQATLIFKQGSMLGHVDFFGFILIIGRLRWFVGLEPSNLALRGRLPVKRSSVQPPLPPERVMTA